ncbi:MAG: GNAT family N-acetyltransferase [Desulfuromonadaceae bacterium]
MQIRLATSADQGCWDDYVGNHPEGTAYQLFAWKNAVKKAYGFEGPYLLAQKGSTVCGILPLIDFSIPFFKKSLISLPYCDAGGVLADDCETADKLLEEAVALASKTDAIVHVRSTRELPFFSINTTEKVRMLLDLPESSEIFFSGLKSKLRTKIKKPLKHGYEVKLGSCEFIDHFYAVFAENMHELGSPVHSRKWIEAIVSEYQEKVKIAVVFAPEGIPVAAGMILLHPTTVSNPWASSLRKYNYMKPNMLLYSTLLSFASDHGYKKFDFGRSTPGEGTYQFKEQWGAQPHPLYWYGSDEKNRPTETSGKVASNLNKRELLARAWKHIPVSSANWLGPKIRRYISL